jgi:hypothetical protein
MSDNAHIVSLPATTVTNQPMPPRNRLPTDPTSQIKIDTQLNYRGSDESVVSKLLDGKNALSLSEKLTVEAEARGADCHLNDVKVTPSGEIGKVLAALFDANGKAREALEQGLSDACKK